MKWKAVVSKIVSIFRWLIDAVTNYIYALVYNGPSEHLPTIQNLLLLESATSLALRIRSGKLKSRALVEAYVERIQQVQPIVNCIVDERFQKALKEADQVDALVESGVKTPEQMAEETPFLGVPFTTKDSISVTGLSHTAGLVARQGLKAEKDAEVVSRMRKAGAIPVAVTNISELCMWWESSNNIYGRCNNPYNTFHIVGGSSGGEAAILASAGSVVGLGSDVGGSIRMPCFFCGIFGHKPSIGIVPNGGQIPKAEAEICSYLSTGPMCRYASDLIPLLKVISGNNASVLHLDDKVDMSKLKIYYTNEQCGNQFISRLNSDMKNTQAKVLNHFRNAFKTKPICLPLTKLKNAFAMWSVLMSTADAPTFSEELAQRKGQVNAYWELCKWFFWCSSHTLPAIGLALTQKMSPQRNSEPAIRMKNLCSDFKRELEDILGDNGVLIFPSHPEAAPYHHQPLFKPFNFVYTAIFNVLSLPVTQCPLGLNSKGLPVGIQIVAANNRDRLSLAVAMELEKAFGGWVSPSPSI